MENGTLAYDGKGLLEFSEENSLTSIACQHSNDEQPRACAFDAHLVDHDPVTPPDQFRGVIRPDFVLIGDAYYRRVHLANESADSRVVTHDVEEVTAQTVLADSALNISNQSSPIPDDLPIAHRVATTGDTVMAFKYLDGDNLGRIYQQNGSYYTVVGTDMRVIDNGVGFLEDDLSRDLLRSFGLVLIVGTLLRYTRNRDR